MICGHWYMLEAIAMGIRVIQRYDSNDIELVGRVLIFQNWNHKIYL
jgi:hypothetical protein